MKTKEELNALKEEIETLNKKLAELTAEELAQVFGGSDTEKPTCPRYRETVDQNNCGWAHPQGLCPIAIHLDSMFYKCPVYSEIFKAIPAN